MKDRTPYIKDILGNDFECCKIDLNNDYEGEVQSTLIRRKTTVETDKSVLYVHGFNDYFFQSEMAERFNNQGCDFYALDLRKYGRSFMPHQKFNDIRNLKDYYEEIIAALDIIHQEGHKTATLMGHSTGGLILTMFAKNYSGSKLFDGLILNSPFFEFNKSRLVKCFIPLVSWIGKHYPSIKISGGFAKEYGEYLHKDFFGEWDYDLNWKPNVAPNVNLGWIRAIYEGQKELRHTFHIEQPCLVLHSARSAYNIKDVAAIQTSDTILNIEDIEHIAKNIQGNVEVAAIDGGVHDLVLSKEDVRGVVYDTMWAWMKQHGLI